MTEIKLFNEWLETTELSTSGIALWYALMYIANRSGWKPELSIPVSALCLRTKLSRSSIYKERNILRDHGLIDFDCGDGRQSSNYRINGFEQQSASTFVAAPRTQPETQSENPSAVEPKESTLASTGRTQMETPPENSEMKIDEPSAVVSGTATQPGIQNEDPSEASTLESTSRTQAETEDELVSATQTQPCTIYKHKQDISLETEEINNGGSGEKRKSAKSPKKKKTDFDLSFISDPAWESLVRTWLDYKHSRNEGYKSELSVKKFHTMLRNLSDDDAGLAGKIIDKSIANNWAGVFELSGRSGDTELAGNSPRTGKPAAGQRIGQIKQPEDEERRRRLLEKFDKKK